MKAAWLALAALFGAPAALAQPVQGDISAAGFPARVQSRFVIREGQWFPILAKLTVPGSQVFQGWGAVERVDIDGDRVSYTERPITVSPGAGVRRVWCYAVSIKEDTSVTMDLDLIADDGERVNRLASPVPEFIGNDAMLILDISEPQLPELLRLDSGGGAYVGLNYGLRRYYRPICVATLPAADLPDRWFGLEAVDVLVWDDPKPEQLSPAQLDAIAGWVRRGGQLVIGLGQAGVNVSKSPLDAIMPIRGIGSSVETNSLPAFGRRFTESGKPELSAPASIALGQPTADAFVALAEDLPGNPRAPLLAWRLVESGRVLATTARLRDLTSGGVRAEFFRELFDLNPHTDSFRQREQGYSAPPVGLYGYAIEPIEFRALASLRMLVAFAFVAAYILLSTWATWSFLRRKSATQHSWTAFAAFAVAASVVSIGAVTVFQGVSDRLNQVSFVDLTPGSRDAHVRAYFGYKSPIGANVDFSLTSDDGFLRPLATGTISAVRYATPGRYSAVAARGLIEDAPIRATLKQFEGCWHGPIEGTIRGQLAVDRRTGKLDPDSFIQNDLRVDISNGVLLFIDPRLRDVNGDVPARVAGLTDRRSYRFKDRIADVPPSISVLAVPIGEIKAGQRASGLAQKEYADYDKALTEWQNKGSEAKLKDEPTLPTLWNVQNQAWMPAYTLGGQITRLGADTPRLAAAMASTRNLYLHNGGNYDFDEVGLPISTEGLMSVDVTHWLTRGNALLLAFSADPGPQMLARAGEPLRVRDGFTLYRVRIPLSYTGAPGAPTRPEDSRP